MTKAMKFVLPYLLGTFLIFLIFAFKQSMDPDYKFVYLFYSVNFVYLMVKIVFAYPYTPCKSPVKKFKVSVVMPSYNESEESVVKAVKTLLKQTYKIHEIIFVDDGSTSDAAYQAVKKINLKTLAGINEVNRSTKIICLRLEKNAGKKKAQEIGFQRATGELFLLVDSDGEITTNALEEMIRPFYSSRVGSVVGRVEVRNVNDSYWTRVQDIFYSNSFQIGRAAQSQTGCVVVCSGALSLHRAKFVRRNMQTFQKEKFFGIPCSAGDDRLLTDISLERSYKTVYQSTAVCYTDVPVTFKQLFKQQARWAKSAYLMTIYSLRYFFIRPVAVLWSMTETYLWLYNFIGMVVLLCKGQLGLNLQMLLAALVYFVLISYLTNTYYSRKNLLTYLFSFYYSIGYSVVLLVIRLYALATIFKTGWATR
ncbi:glycosyltransferase [Enterococcus sp. UD-01]|uniref:glycosyltransferase n=1 Tax=Enterococcus sp. UD-01 TaxID=3373911 RepID=UPI003834DCE9